MKLTPLKRYIAGVDPGERTGIGVYDRTEQRIVMLATTDFFGVQPWFLRHLRIAELKVYVEVNAPFMYDRNNDSTNKTRDRMMLNMGGVRREAQLLLKGLKLAGFDAEEVLPIRQKKWTDDQFRIMTKCTRQTNAHERDGARIALIYANKRSL